MVALSSTFLVVKSVRQSMTFFFFRGDTSIFPERVTYAYLDNAFFDQFLVFCVALCGLMV